MAASRTVSRALDLSADAARVWEAVSTTALLERWLGVQLHLELRAGASGIAHDADGSRLVRVDLVEAPERLVFTWWPLDEGAEPSRVDLGVASRPGGSRLTVTETALADLDLGAHAGELAEAGR